MSRTLKAVGKAMAPQTKASNLSWKEKLHPEEYELLKNTFALFDEDNSGIIDPEEINRIMEELGEQRRGTMVYEMIGSLKDLNRPINFNEFLDFVCHKVGDVKTKEGLKRIFRHADKEEDELLDFEEVKSLSRMAGDYMNDEELMEMLHTIHINRGTSTNEGIGFEEFYNIVTGFYKK